MTWQAAIGVLMIVIPVVMVMLVAISTVKEAQVEKRWGLLWRWALVWLGVFGYIGVALRLVGWR